MKRIVKIPNVGNVAFPDQMSDADVSGAAQKLHSQANPKGIEDVIHALVKMEKGPSSKVHEKMAGVAQVLEQTPALLQLAIAGLSAVNQPATGSGSPQPEQQQTQSQPESQVSGT